MYDDDDLLTNRSSKRLRSTDLIPYSYQQENAPTNNSVRTSSLDAPTLKLSGHQGSVYSLAFSPDGESLLSGSFDMTCLLWNVASGRCENYNVLKGHSNAVLSVDFSLDSAHCVSASADSTLAWWDASTGSRIKRLVGHKGIVNSVDSSRTSAKLISSCGDDGTARIWDVRLKGREAAVAVLSDSGSSPSSCIIPRTAVVYGADGNTLFVGGIDNGITVFDLRTRKKIMFITGHDDTITGLALNPAGTHLLSNSMDGTLKTWDIRPFAGGGNQKRHCKTFVGITHNAEKGLLNCSWNMDGTLITGGSADRIVHVWDELSTEELYYLPGHSGCVNAVVFHPKEHLIASASSDKSIYVGELSR